jgi:diacylglycerol kinase family enzyme
VVAKISVVSGREIDVTVRRAAASRGADGERQFDIVVVGGGDGTISAASSVLAGGDLPLGILPLGNFNHFARDLGIPLELDTAIETIARNHVASVDVGEVNGRVFVNNSSLGIYPHLVAERDRHRRRGLARWAAAALASCRVLWRLPRPQVRALAPGWASGRRTPCVFVGNNLYQLDAFAIARRSRLDQGKLCVYIATPQGRLALMRLAVRAFLGRLETEADVTPACLESLEIWTRRRRLAVALDGEAMVFRTPLHYRIRPRALRVIIPEPATL